MVGRLGFEPRTPCLKGRCSNQAELTTLNYLGKCIIFELGWQSNFRDENRQKESQRLVKVAIDYDKTKLH